jgi:hypothetical protein
VEGGSEIEGNADHLVNLKELTLFGRNTIDFNIANFPLLEKTFIAGLSTPHGDAGELINMYQFETTLARDTPPYPETLIYGNIEGWTGIKIICSFATLSGDVSDLHEWRYLSEGNDSTIHGNLDNSVYLFEYIPQDSAMLFDFTFESFPEMQTFNGTYCTDANKPLRFIQCTPLITFRPKATWVWTSEEVNQLLADLWANRDEDKTNEYERDGCSEFFKSDRSIHLNTIGSGPPTGQGITDKTNLEAYRSPNNDPQYDLWTIETN